MTRQGRSRKQKSRSRQLGIEDNPRKRPRDTPSPECVSLSRFLEAQTEVESQRTRGNRFKMAKYNEVKKVKRAVASKLDLATQLEELRVDLDNTRNELDNALAALALAERTIDSLVSEIERLKRARDASRKAKSRLLAKQALVTDRATARVKTQYMKSKGTILQPIRNAVMELISRGVPESKLNDIVHVVARAFGIEIPDSISQRSVGRIASEAFATCCIQLGDEISQEKCFTLSADGTSNKNLNYESKHITLSVPNYDDLDSPKKPQTRLLSITTAVNHTSETQLEGLKSVLDEIATTFRQSPLGRTRQSDLSVELLATYLKGLGTDHSQDQRKLERLIRSWKEHSDRFLRGRSKLAALNPSEIASLVANAGEEMIEKMGGTRNWNLLNAREQQERRERLLAGIMAGLGEEAFSNLSHSERASSSLFLWAGCCMHKEMNTVKYGASAMKTAWSALDLEGPMKLFNRDNASAVRDGNSAAARRAETVSEGGGVKLTSLAGALLNHKDKKKGHQDTVGCFFESYLGYTLRFPDTSNTRYQSHCDAAGVILVHYDLLVDFLDVIRFKKESGSFNHLEQNVFAGLADSATLTELCVLVLYSEAISQPYMRRVRGSSSFSTNALDLGPLHEALKDHCQLLVDSPELVASESASYEKGSLDGLPWEHPERIYAVQRLLQAGKVPHLCAIFVAFLRGALEGWRNFTTEFLPGGFIAECLPSNRCGVFINPTNDCNEGALGTYRVTMRHAPNMTLVSHNGRQLYRKNQTGSWSRSHLGSSDYRYIRKLARKINESGRRRRDRLQQAQYDRELSGRKKVRLEELRIRRQNRLTELSTVHLSSIDEIDVAQGSKCLLTLLEMKKQLAWYRDFANDKKVPSGISALKKALTQQELIKAIKRYQVAGQVNDDPELLHNEVNPEEEEEWEDLAD